MKPQSKTIAIVGLLFLALVSVIVYVQVNQSSQPDASNELVTDTAVYQHSTRLSVLPIRNVLSGYEISQFLRQNQNTKSQRMPIADRYVALADSFLALNDTSKAIHWFQSSICNWPNEIAFEKLRDIYYRRRQLTDAISCQSILTDLFANPDTNNTEREWKLISFYLENSKIEGNEYCEHIAFERIMTMFEKQRLVAADRNRLEMSHFKYRPEVQRLFIGNILSNQDTVSEWFNIYQHYFQTYSIPILITASKINHFPEQMEAPEPAQYPFALNYIINPQDFTAVLPFWRKQRWGSLRGCYPIGKAEINGNIITLFTVDTLGRSNATPPEFRPIYAFWVVHNAQGRLLDYKIVARQYNTETASLNWESANRLVTTVYNRRLERPFRPGHHNLDNRVEEITEAYRLAFSIGHNGHITVDTLRTEAPDSSLSQN